MIPIRCNKCFTISEVDASLAFQLTRCHHIVCEKCHENTDMKDCPVCQSPFQGTEIVPIMPENISYLFSNPAELFEMYMKAFKFQSEQQTLCIQHFNLQEEDLHCYQNKLEAYAKMESHLRKQVDVEKKRIEELSNYIAFYERRDDTSSSTSGSTTASSIVNGETRSRQRPRTPLFNEPLSDDELLINSEIEEIFGPLPRNEQSILELPDPFNIKETMTNDDEADISDDMIFFDKEIF